MKEETQERRLANLNRIIENNPVEERPTDENQLGKYYAYVYCEGEAWPGNSENDLSSVFDSIAICLATSDYRHNPGPIFDLDTEEEVPYTVEISIGVYNEEEKGGYTDEIKIGKQSNARHS